MLHIHLQDCVSTQTYLKSKLESFLQLSSSLLVSCNQQTSGYGRDGKQWHSLENSLSFSCVVSSNEESTLTPLEIGILLSNFILARFGVRLKLKWPNDLLTTDYKKCGGIICHKGFAERVVVGIGINLGKIDKNILNLSFDTPIDSVDRESIFSSEEKKRISQQIYKYILKNRMSSKTVRDKWIQNCIHTNQQVSLNNSGCVTRGTFVGISDQGLAQIIVDEKLNSFASGNLRILSSID